MQLNTHRSRRSLSRGRSRLKVNDVGKYKDHVALQLESVGHPAGGGVLRVLHEDGVHDVRVRGLHGGGRRQRGGLRCAQGWWSLLEVQAKSLRGFGYVFMRKEHFVPKATLYVALGLLVDGKEPTSFSIPSEVWRAPNGVFVDRDDATSGLRSKREWGIHFSRKNLPALEPFALQPTLARLAAQ